MKKILLIFYFILHLFVGLPLSIACAFLGFVFYGWWAVEQEASDWIEEWFHPYRLL